MQAYRKALEYVQERIATVCASRGSHYLLVSSEDQMGDVFFGKMVEREVLK